MSQASPAKVWLMRKLVPTLVLAFVRLLDWSWRYREVDRQHLQQVLDSGRAPVGAFFHGRTFCLLRFMSRPRNGRWLSMCSKSLDGDAMAKVEESLGFTVVRGSSGRDGLQAVIEMIRLVRDDAGLGACLAVDGSRGPRGRVQGGVVSVAQRSGAMILPVTAAAKPAHIFRKAWDRTLLPWPFAKVYVIYGEPIAVPAKLKADAFEAIRADLETRMIALQERVNGIAGFQDPDPIAE